jgi:hypothetical protein
MEFLPRTIGHLLAQWPDISVTVEERLSHELACAVIDGEAEIGIIASVLIAKFLRSSVLLMDGRDGQACGRD